MPKRRQMTCARWLQSLLLGSIIALLYAATLTSWHTGDDIQWTMKVRTAVTGEPPLHPASAATIVRPPATPERAPPQVRYFLELPTHALISKVSMMMEWSDDVVRRMQLTHAITGAAGVAIFFCALALLLPRMWSLVISLGLAFSYAWWYYSTHPDYTIISHTLSTVLLYLLVLLVGSRSALRSRRLALALGVVNALAILYLLTGLLLVPVIVVTLLLSNDTRESWAGIALYLSSMLLAILMFGGVAWIGYMGASPQLRDLWGGLTYSGAFAHEFVPLDVPKTLYGLAKALLTYPGLSHQAPRELLAESGPTSRVAFLAWYAAAMIIAALPFVALANRFRQLDKHRTLAIGLGVWFFIQVPFAAYWEPSYIKWWTGALIPWWALIGVLVAVTSSRPPFLTRALSIALPTFVVILFGVNLLSEFLPNSRAGSNPWLQVAETLGNSSEPRDLFLSAGNHRLDFYLPYFARRHTLSYDLIGVASGEDAARQAIGEAVQATNERGGRIFVYHFTGDSVEQFRENLGFSSACYEVFTPAGIAIPGFVVYEVTGPWPWDELPGPIQCFQRAG
jgi:hypothetical protein